MSTKVTATIVINGQTIVIEAENARELEREIRHLRRLSHHLEAVEPPADNLLTEG